MENVAAVRHENLEFLVAYDRDYEDVPEYITPKDFIKRSAGFSFGLWRYELDISYRRCYGGCVTREHQNSRAEINDFEPANEHRAVFGSGDAGEKITKVLECWNGDD